MKGRKPLRHLRWHIVAMLFLATVISYVDRQVLSVNAPFIRDDLGLSNAQYSYLVTSFLVAYTIGQTLTGKVVDLLGTRTGFTICILWWSIAGMLHAASQGVKSLAMYRFLLGLGEAGSWPSSMRAISEWFPVRERSLASGIFGGGTAIGAVVSPPLVAFLTLTLGWRSCFLVTASFGFFWIIWWLRLYSLPEDHPRIEPAERKMILRERMPVQTRKIPIRNLLRRRKPWGIILGRFMVDPVWWFYVFWLPSYLADVRGFNLQQIGLFAWIPFLAADAGNILGGWLSGFLYRKGVSLTWARKTVLFLGALGTLFGIPAGMAEAAWLSLAAITAATFSIGLWTTNAITLNTDILPAVSVGSMTGLSGTGAGMGGIFFTLLTGWLVDHVSYLPVFVLAGIMPLVGFALLAILTGKLELLSSQDETLDAA